jgi:hypothetical protein
MAVRVVEPGSRSSSGWPCRAVMSTSSCRQRVVHMGKQNDGVARIFARQQLGPSYRPASTATSVL